MVDIVIPTEQSQISNDSNSQRTVPLNGPGQEKQVSLTCSGNSTQQQHVSDDNQSSQNIDSSATGNTEQLNNTMLLKTLISII